MPSVKKNENESHYMGRCVPMLIKEGKSKKQAIAQCLNMFKEKWKAKGSSPNWDECPECVQRELEANRKVGIFELDIPNNQF